MASYLAITLAFLLAVNSAFALQCYSCDSSKGVLCNYGLLSFTYPTAECGLGQGKGFLDTVASIIPSNCVKLVGVNPEGKEYVARGCAPSTGPINACNAIAKVLQFANGEDLKLDCYTCNTDHCNSAPKVAGMTLVGLLAACFVFLF